MMGIKKQLGMAVASAVVGVTLLGGGTYAYFSSSETSNNTFAAGTLDLSADPTTVVDVKDLKPGDTVERDFELQNNGSMDIKKVMLDTDYSVIDDQGDNGDDDFGDHIQVKFLYNADKMDEVIYETTLAKLKDMKPEAVKEKVFDDLLDDKGLEAGSEDDLVVQFKFLDNGEDQNKFQGDKLNLEWKFTAEQGDSDEK